MGDLKMGAGSSPSLLQPDPTQSTNGRSVFDRYASPMYIMAKAPGAACNLDCRYCYYTEKGHLYPHAKGMSDDTLQLFVRQYIEAQSMPQVLFTWHGGEPLLRPITFYERAMRLQQYYAQGRQIDNCIQTNGTLLTDDWCRFFKDNRWLVGVSIDGPARFHDPYRRHRHGGVTHADVMRGIEMLGRHGVEWNAMAVINNLNVCHPEEFYRFFKSIDCHYIQFTPVVERIHTHADGRHLASPQDIGEYRLTEESITPEQWGDFLCRLFDEWVKTDVGEYFIPTFEATLANWIGVPPGICAYDRECGHVGVIESNGDVYQCDHFVFPANRLGNIHSATLVEMMYSERQRRFGAAKTDTLPTLCRQCRWLFACHGECPRLRFARTPDGEPGLNYLCPGYRRYYEHTAPFMASQAREASTLQEQ